LTFCSSRSTIQMPTAERLKSDQSLPIKSQDQGDSDIRSWTRGKSRRLFPQSWRLARQDVSLALCGSLHTFNSAATQALVTCRGWRSAAGALQLLPHPQPQPLLRHQRCSGAGAVRLPPHTQPQPLLRRHRCAGASAVQTLNLRGCASVAKFNEHCSHMYSHAYTTFG
jgi:hypothetical protein